MNKDKGTDKGASRQNSPSPAATNQPELLSNTLSTNTDSLNENIRENISPASKRKRSLNMTGGSPSTPTATNQSTVTTRQHKRQHTLDAENTSHQEHTVSHISSPDEYAKWDAAQQSLYMMKLLKHTRTPTLRYISSILNPVLKRDFLTHLPMELASHILSHLVADDVPALCRCAQVSI